VFDRAICFTSVVVGYFPIDLQRARIGAIGFPESPPFHPSSASFSPFPWLEDPKFRRQLRAYIIPNWSFDKAKESLVEDDKLTTETYPQLFHLITNKTKPSQQLMSV
jgi:hypothetical protein